MAAVTLCACTPPGEVASTVKVRTATGVAAPAATAAHAIPRQPQPPGDQLPGFIDCVGVPGKLPKTFSLDCSSDNDKMTAVSWTAVTATTATGTGTRITTGENGSEYATAGVTVVLSDPVVQPDGPVFSTVTINGEVVPLG